MDELISKSKHINLSMTKVGLNLDKNIYLIRAFEDDSDMKKKYIRNMVILVDDEFLTTTFTDTVHLMEELNLFDYGNDQNKYLEVVEHQKTKNLQLKVENDHAVYISKSEAKTIYKLFNLSMIGYSLTRVLEFEYRFTPETLTNVLYHNDYLKLGQ